MSRKAEQLREIVLSMLSDLEWNGSTGTIRAKTGFDLYPRDYLEFAEPELGNSDLKSRINCISHLKRASECQMDVFLRLLSLDRMFDKFNLGYQSKLGFLGAIGALSPMSLSRLNNIRNKMEHKYVQPPDSQDIQVYYDLTLAFVSAIELAAQQFLHHSKTSYTCPNFNSIDLDYDFDAPAVNFRFIDVREPGDVRLTAACTGARDLDDFAYFLKTHLMLQRLVYKIAGNRFIENHLKQITSIQEGNRRNEEAG